MISVRLDEGVEEHLDRVAALQGVSRSELVRDAINRYLSRYDHPTPWELGKELFGKHGSKSSKRSK
jgi:metal-responsive CopG/Arc/MetJ family transcriptional regulator